MSKPTSRISDPHPEHAANPMLIAHRGHHIVFTVGDADKFARERVNEVIYRIPDLTDDESAKLGEQLYSAIASHVEKHLKEARAKHATWVVCPALGCKTPDATEHTAEGLKAFENLATNASLAMAEGIEKHLTLGTNAPLRMTITIARGDEKSQGDKSLLKANFAGYAVGLNHVDQFLDPEMKKTWAKLHADGEILFGPALRDPENPTKPSAAR